MSRKNKYPFRFIVLLLCLHCFGSYKASAQDLCANPAGTEKGKFSMEVFNNANPKTVIVTDQSGGENVRYNYVYQGEPANQLNPNVPLRDRYSYTGYTEPTLFTIIQYGTKNGKPMYACLNHVVRQSNRAKYSFVPCSNTSILVNIPKDSLFNIFDSYEISFDNFATIAATVSATDLPYEGIFTKNLPTYLYVRGRFDDASKDYSLTVGSDFVPNASFTSSTGIDLPHSANITALVMNKKEVAIDFRGGLGNTTYAMYKRPINGTYPTTPELKGLKPGRVNVKLNEVDEHACFYFKKEQSTCRVEESAEICTIPMKSIDRLQAKNRVHYSTYPQVLQENNAINKINVTSSTLVVTQDNQGFTTKTLSPNPLVDSTEYLVFDCSKTYCHTIEMAIEGVYKGLKFRSTIRSNTLCSSPSDEEIDLNVALSATLDQGNFSVINVEQIKPSIYPIDYYYLYHQGENGFEITDTLKPPLKDFLTSDDGSEKSQCYKIKLEDRCGSDSKLSDPICTIFLQFKDNAVLQWSENNPFTGELQNYEVLTKGPSGLIDKSFYELGPEEFEYKPNLTLFEDEATFQIQAISSIGVSLSNVVIKELAPSIYFPTAFSPNSDNLNENLTYIGRRDRIKALDFVVYNRTGELVYETNEIDFKWAPSPQNVQVGSYAYYLKLTLFNDEVISKKGQFEILK